MKASHACSRLRVSQLPTFFLGFHAKSRNAPHSRHSREHPPNRHANTREQHSHMKVSRAYSRLRVRQLPTFFFGFHAKSRNAPHSRHSREHPPNRHANTREQHSHMKVSRAYSRLRVSQLPTLFFGFHAKSRNGQHSRRSREHPPKRHANTREKHSHMKASHACSRLRVSQLRTFFLGFHAKSRKWPTFAPFA